MSYTRPSTWKPLGGSGPPVAADVSPETSTWEKVTVTPGAGATDTFVPVAVLPPTGPAPASNAPTSHAPTLRRNPRWSVAGHAALSPVLMATLGGEIDSVKVGPPLLAGEPSTTEATVRVTRPGPKPRATHDPSLSIEASPTAVKEPPPSQSLVLLRTISELVMFI